MSRWIRQRPPKNRPDNLGEAPGRGVWRIPALADLLPLLEERGLHLAYREHGGIKEEVI